MFLKEVYYSMFHQGSIYVLKNTDQIYHNLK